MIELPEARVIASDLRKEILNKKVKSINSNFTSKFLFTNDTFEDNSKRLIGKQVTHIIDRNFYVEIEIEEFLLLFRDGINIRYNNKVSKEILSIVFDDSSYLSIGMSMMGACLLYDKRLQIDNAYYQKELEGLSPLDKSFTLSKFKSMIGETTSKLSAKEFLGTKQRFLGIGNGVLLQILFHAKIHPKTKMKDLSDKEIDNLYHVMIGSINEMITLRGRDSEKDIYNQDGNYYSPMSNKHFKEGCPSCKGLINKESYLGGSIYYCPNCQEVK